MFLFKYFIKLLMYIISPLIILLLILISPFKVIRLCFLPSHRIGELAETVFMYLLQKKTINSFDIFFSADKISNNFFFNYIKKKIIIKNHLFIHPIWKILFLLKKNFIFFEKFLLLRSGNDKYFFTNKSKKFSLTKEDLIKGADFLNKIGIQKNAKIVCLIVRDKKYLKKKFPNNDFSYHDYRNAKITSYKRAIEYLISKNYYVFRMGVDYEKELRIKNKKFIDYSKKYRNDFLDIYLASKCDFVITSDTGWDAIPHYYFKKPMLFTNLAPYHTCKPYLKSTINLPKHYYSIKSKKKISPWKVSEIISQPYNGYEYYKKGILIKENTSVEIKKATEEMCNQLTKKSFLKKNIKTINMWKKFNLFININNSTYNKNKSPKAKFSNYFLNKNKKLLDI